MKWISTWSLVVGLTGVLGACKSSSDTERDTAKVESESEVKTSPTIAMKAKGPLPPPSQGESQSQNKSSANTNTASAETPAPAAASSSSPPPSSTPPSAPADSAVCVGIGPAVKVPYFVQKPPVVLINFLKTCTTAAGEPGFVKGSSWTAMGFPCTGGRGRIDKRGGSESVPALVHFHLQTSCLMDPSSAPEAEKTVRQKLRMPEDSQLIAYYPFSVQYWEFVQFPDRDTGLSPTLYSENGIQQGWMRFVNKSEPIRVKLYGRENAWVRGKELFEVEALLQFEGRSTFRLNVLQAKALSPEEKAAVMQRCDEIKPKRNCAEIFAD